MFTNYKNIEPQAVGVGQPQMLNPTITQSENLYDVKKKKKKKKKMKK